jgi:hypothetical protein
MLIHSERMDRRREEGRGAGRGGDGLQGVRPLPRPQHVSITAEELERR